MDIHELLAWIGVGMAGVFSYMAYRALFEVQSKKR